MRRQSIWVFLSLVVAIALPLGVAAADTSISFGLRLGDRYRGPAVGVYDESDAVPVPGSSGVYYVRGSRNDVYRYGNAWYMNYNGDWYRAMGTQGPWVFVGYRSVPRAVYTVPTRYRRWNDYRDRHYMGTSSGNRYRDRDRYGRSGIGISLRIGDRYRGPDLGFYDEPTMIRVPGSYVYYTQDSDNDVYRYGNYWYMNYDGDWYRAGSFRGPWVFVSFRSVPRDVYSVPTQYRRRWSDYRDQHYEMDTSSSDDNVYYRGGTTTSSLTLRIGSRYSGPSVEFGTEPDVIAVPGTRGVYYVQDSDSDIYRYGNNWYMNYNGDWYRAGSYNGPWVFVGYRSVPRDVYSVPSTYRRNWSDYRDRHYDDSDDNE